MQETGNLTIPLPTRLDVAAQLVLITRFIATVCWLGVIAAVSIIPTGALLLLAVPLIVVASFGVARHARAKSSRVHEEVIPSSPAGSRAASVPVYYAAALSWSIMAALIFHDNPVLVVLTAMPLLGTAAAYKAEKHSKRLRKEDAHR